MPHTAPLLILLLALLPTTPAAAAAKPIRAFNTYEAAPFLIAGKQGLVPELVDYLNRLLVGRYRLQLRNLPRARLLQQHLREPAQFDGVVMLLSPGFVGDAQQRDYLWSKPLFQDHNVLVMRAEQAPAEADRAWLQGKRLLAVRGQRLRLLDELVKNGQLQREDFNSELQTLQMVAAGRGDLTFMNRLMYRHLSRKTGLGERLVAVPVPGGEAGFTRHILVGRHVGELLAPLNAAIDALHCEPEWRTTAARYGFAALPCQAANDLSRAPARP